MSNDLVYDTPRKKEIDSFLRYIYQIKKSNPGLEIDKSIVYHELCRNGIRNSDIDFERKLMNNREMFPRWSFDFFDSPGIAAYNDPGWPYFFQFVNGNFDKDDGFIKLYIPIDYTHLYDGVKILFEYIRKLNIQHLSKVSEEVRSDNVIVRLPLDDSYNALKIINFVNSNPYLKSGLNKTNPFIPTINGIGFMKEHGISYNSEISKLISSYIEKCYKSGKNDVSEEDFSLWLKNNNYDQEVGDVYSIACGKPVESLSSNQKVGLLLDTLKATFEKYDYMQVVTALYKSLNGDYSYFTNGTKDSPNYRSLLVKSVTPATIRVFISAALKQISGKDMDTMNQMDAIREYCSYMFNDEIMSKFEDACKVTLDKYGYEQLNGAINSYLFKGDALGFSRYKNVPSEGNPINYRKIVSSLDKNSVINAMKKSLILRGIDCSNLNDVALANLYSSELSKSLYETSQIKSVSI